MNVLTKKVAIVSFLASIAVFGVACSDDEGGGDITPANAVVSDENGEYGALTCAGGLSAIDLPIGSRQDIDGTSFELNEAMTVVPEYSSADPVQESVSLKAELASNISLPAVVIHTTDGAANSGSPSDGKLSLGLSAGGTGNYTIISDAYIVSIHPYEGKIIGLTLCLDYSNSQPQSK